MENKIKIKCPQCGHILVGCFCPNCGFKECEVDYDEWTVAWSEKEGESDD